MLPAKRLEYILELLQKERFVTVSSLSELMQVTEKTIREDLEKLEARGLLERVRGGATLPVDSSSNLFPVHVPNTKALSEKQYIAKQALSMIEQGDIIALDAGSTMLELAKLLPNQPLTVVTNDLYIMNELTSRDQIRLVVPGGYRNKNLLLGAEAIEFIRKLNIHKAFISATGVDVEHGLTIFTGTLLEQKRAWIESAAKVYCAVDSDKLGKSALFTFATFQEVHGLFTDQNADPKLIQTYAEQGLKVYT